MKISIKLIFTILSLITTVSITAQVKIGDNPNTINPNSILEIESTNKGLLLPRIALISTSSPSPLSAHIAGMTVYNTATAGDVVPGYYYNNGSKWIEIGDASKEPWYGTDDNSPATLNTEDIYTMGNVGIGVNTPSSGLQVHQDDTIGSVIRFSAGNASGNYLELLGLNGTTLPSTISNDLYTKHSNLMLKTPFSRNLIIKIQNNDSTDGIHMINNIDEPVFSVTKDKVGIGTVAPTATLDVNGVARIRGLNSLESDDDQVLVVDNNGFVHKTTNIAQKGQIISSIKASDHGGWYLLNGRPLSSLPTNAKSAAVALGLSGNLPNASNTYLSQNGGTLGSVTGSNSRTLTQANLPNVNFTGTTSTNGNHRHATNASDNGGATDGTTAQAANTYQQVGFYTKYAGNHSHSVTVSSGGSNAPMDIKPRTLSVNMFIYLGK